MLNIVNHKKEKLSYNYKKDCKGVFYDCFKEKKDKTNDINSICICSRGGNI